jgi:hypothetical protein
MQDIVKYVVDKGRSQITSKDKIGENFYNRAIWNSVLIAEAIRTAQQITGKKLVNGEDVRRGFESLDITPARMKELATSPAIGGAAGLVSDAPSPNSRRSEAVPPSYAPRLDRRKLKRC